MSTRAQITVKGTGIYIYKHSDGYEEGVLPVLAPFVARFHKERGNDPEYLLAQIVREFARVEEASRIWRLAESATPGDGGELGEYYDFLGWGISTELHGDEKFIYVVDAATGKIEVRRPKACFWDNPTLENTTRVRAPRRTVAIDQLPAA